MLCQIFQTDGNWRFFGYDFAMSHGYDPAAYKRVYEFEVDDDYTPEDAFFEFNQPRLPDNYYARSLSVSDIVVLDDVAYYCDDCGFEPLSEEDTPTA